MKRLTSTSLRFIPAALGLALCLVANNAKAYYFDVNGAAAGYGIVNGGSYSWDDPNWAASSGGGVATVNWVPGDFARFAGGASGYAYTVTVNNDESMAGLYETVTGVTLTINAAGSGALDIVPAVGPPALVQGFLVSGAASTVTINAPITGTGGIYPQLSGHLNLFGNNTYSGGTYLGSSATLTYFNNNNSFGSGTITVNEASGNYGALLSTGGSTITLANNFVNAISGGGVNFANAVNTPVISTGTWSLGANNINLRNNGTATAPLTLAGQISGTGGLTVNSLNHGIIILSGANTYTGPTTVGVSGAALVTLKLGAANTIASSSSLIMAGGTLDPGGFNHAMPATTLGLTANSTIDFVAGASELDFANSSALTWSGVLNLADWTFGVDKLRFGTDATGLTVGQLADIEFNGAGLGTAQLDSLGYVVVPEPSTALLGLLGGLGLMWTVRRRTA